MENIETLIDIGEQQYVDYIMDNKEFLKEFHQIYYTEYRNSLNGYCLSDYMITAYVEANKIADYNDYNEFVEKYLQQLAGDEEEAIEIYNSYYNCFIENVTKQTDRVKEKYNKNDDDIYIAYEIKVIFQFYTGFLIEKILMEHINNYSGYTVADRGLEDKRYIDYHYAVDVEVVADTGAILAMQCKSYTYLNISNDKK